MDLVISLQAVLVDKHRIFFKWVYIYIYIYINIYIYIFIIDVEITSTTDRVIYVRLSLFYKLVTTIVLNSCLWGKVVVQLTLELYSQDSPNSQVPMT